MAPTTMHPKNFRILKGKSNGFMKNTSENFLHTSEIFFELYIEVTLGEARIEVRSIIMRSSNADSVIISRELTTVAAKMQKDRCN